jgi:hypothetical protein
MAPTADMSIASVAWLAAADESMAHWQAFLKTDLAPFNDQLQKAQQKRFITTDDAQPVASPLE